MGRGSQFCQFKTNETDKQIFVFYAQTVESGSWTKSPKPLQRVLYFIPLPWEPTTFLFRGYNPYIGGSKPSLFMVLASKGIHQWSYTNSSFRWWFFRNFSAPKIRRWMALQRYLPPPSEIRNKISCGGIWTKIFFATKNTGGVMLKEISAKAIGLRWSLRVFNIWAWKMYRFPTRSVFHTLGLSDTRNGFPPNSVLTRGKRGGFWNLGLGKTLSPIMEQNYPNFKETL